MITIHTNLEREDGRVVGMAESRVELVGERPDTVVSTLFYVLHNETLNFLMSHPSYCKDCPAYVFATAVCRHSFEVLEEMKTYLASHNIK